MIQLAFQILTLCVVISIIKIDLVSSMIINKNHLTKVLESYFLSLQRRGNFNMIKSMSNKDVAISFLKMTGSGEVNSAYDKYVASDFIHHNQYFKGDRESLMNAMIEAHKKNPNKSIEIKYSYCDGSTVITHSLVCKQEINIAVIHIFRIEGGKIKELWDLGQPIDKKSPNENGLF